MNEKRGRTLVYLAIALGLLTAKYPVGDWLGKVGKANGLAQESLGEVNPVGGTAQLVCFGLRGVAVTMLWNEVIDLQKKERWFEMRPGLTSITLLQPHFVSPWRFQAWNMAYNIGAAWESVKDKFFWIGEGIKFMKDANKRLKNVPDLLWFEGEIYYHKINVADEAKYLREVFRKEPDKLITQSSRARETPDPYDNAYDAFHEANLVVLGDGRPRRPPKGMGSVPFMSNQARARIGYADWMRKEGHFGTANKEAWAEALEEWTRYGKGYNFRRDETKGERDQYIHRLEYEPAELAALDPDTKYWVNHYGDIVRYWHTRTRVRAESTPELLDFRRLGYESISAHEDRQDVDTSVAKAKEAFPRLAALIAQPEYSVLKDDIDLVDDALDVETLYLKLAPRGGIVVPERPLARIFPQAAAIGDAREDAGPRPAPRPAPAVANPGAPARKK